MAYIDRKRIHILDSVNVGFYIDWLLSGDALKHIDEGIGENDRKVIEALYKAGKIDALFFNWTAKGHRRFHDIFNEEFRRGTYYFAKGRREEALHEIAYAIRPFANPGERRSATNCLSKAGLTHDEIRKVEGLVGSRIAPLIREERRQQ